jgi:chromosome segregation ATPase
MDEAKNTKSSTGRQPNLPKPSTIEAEFNKMVSRGVQSSAASEKQKKSKVNAICACGNPEPQFKGYCMDCVQKLKARFDAYLEKWQALKEEAENYNQQDSTKANEKLALMRAKAEQYEIKLSDVQMLDVMDAHSKLTSNEEQRKLAELKAMVMARKQELEIMQFKMAVEAEDFAKNAEWLTGMIEQKQKLKKDQESESSKFMYEFDKVKSEIEDIDKRCYLKKRYVTEYRKLKEREMNKRKTAEQRKTDYDAQFRVVNDKIKVKKVVINEVTEELGFGKIKVNLNNI